MFVQICSEGAADVTVSPSFCETGLQQFGDSFGRRAGDAVGREG